MKITDCELVTVPKMDKFDKIYEIKDEDVLLSSILVYGLNKEEYFYKKSINGNYTFYINE